MGPDDCPNGVGRLSEVEMSRLAGVFDSVDRAANWSDEEYAEILHAFLQSPVRDALERWKLATPAVDEAIERRDLRVVDVLTSTHPELALLEGVKALAKLQDDAPEPDLPPKATRVIYYASIWQALARLKQRITSLPDEDLHDGAKWCLKRAWLPAPLAPIFRTAIQAN